MLFYFMKQFANLMLLVLHHYRRHQVRLIQNVNKTKNKGWMFFDLVKFCEATMSGNYNELFSK